MPRQQASANHHTGSCQDKSLTTSTREPSPRHLLTQGPASHHRSICQDKNLSTSTCEPSPRKLPRQKPYHKLLRNITAAFAKTKTSTSNGEPSTRHLPRQLKPKPHAPANHHRGICQDKNLTTSTREPSPRHCQDKNLTTSTCETSPRPLPRQEPCHKNREPSPRHVPRPKPYHKHPRTITAAFAKTKALPQAPASHLMCSGCCVCGLARLQQLLCGFAVILFTAVAVWHCPYPVYNTCCVVLLLS